MKKTLSITVYNDTIYRLIQFLHKIQYTPHIKTNENTIVFHEEFIYY